ncbi:hypothetical protein ACN28S_19305 [Cystobacter fuscus]
MARPISDSFASSRVSMWVRGTWSTVSPAEMGAWASTARSPSSRRTSWSLGKRAPPSSSQRSRFDSF